VVAVSFSTMSLSNFALTASIFMTARSQERTTLISIRFLFACTGGQLEKIQSGLNARSEINPEPDAQL